MAYIVLIVGALMALLGAFAIVTGYPIIQVERGWATLIAGGSLLAGGVVTMALGLLLRAILDLTKSLAQSSAHALHLPTAQVSLAQASLAQVSSPQGPVAHEVEPHPVAEAVVPEIVPPVVSMPGPITAAAAVVAVPAGIAALSETHEPVASTPPEPEPAPDLAPAQAALDPAILYPSHEPPPIDDWLDRAFADISHNPEPPISASTRARADKTHTGQALIEESETLHASDTTRAAPVIEAEPVHPVETLEDRMTPEPANHESTHEGIARQQPAAAQPAVAPEQDAAIIGRYEADGTFYTMYADGAIEAQSEAGIYRFASMAELKAFIEG